MQSESFSSPNREHIVILGSGFGGWYAARALAPRLPQTDITIIDRVNHLLYTPMLTEVAGGNLQAKHICVPTASLPSRVQVVLGEVKAVDLLSKAVTLADGRVFKATQLVFALGSTTAYHGISGAEEFSLPLKTVVDASRILAKVDDLVEEAARCADVDQRREPLRLMVAGGGYTGVETVAAVAEHLARKVRAAGLAESDVEAMVVEPTERLMQETPASLAKYSQDVLQRQKVRVLLDVGVKRVDKRLVELTDGQQFRVGLLLWDAGIEPSPLLEQTKLPLGKHHGVTVDSCFRVQGFPGIWAIGDCAEIPDSHGKTYAPTAQNATREGVHLAQNISAVLRARQPTPFHYRMLGQLALLSGRTAVAEILGFKMRGAFAWALWWTIYIAKLPSMRSRAGVVKQLAARV